MAHVTETATDVFTVITSDFVVGEGDEAVTHPYAVLRLWSAAELAEIGVYEAVPAVRPLVGQVEAVSYVRDGDVVREVLTLAAPTQAELIAYMKERRFQAEVAGIVVDGAPIATDRESQAMIDGAYSMAMRDAERIFSWQTDAGPVALDAPTLIVVAVAVSEHVQACFDVQSGLWMQIVAGTITSFAEIDAVDWPVQA